MNKIEFEIDGKQVITLEGFYSSKADIEALYLSACNLSFKIEGKPAEDVQNRHNLRLISNVNESFLDQIKLFKGERLDVLSKYVPSEEYEIYRAYCNLGLISDYQDAHVDNHYEDASMTLLIYCNKEWKSNWGGETFFYSDDMKEVKHVSQIEPGKAVLFNGSIPHMAKVQHNYSDNYRLTIAIKFVKRNYIVESSNIYTKTGN